MSERTFRSDPWEDEEQEARDAAFKPLSREQALALRSRIAAVSPWRVKLWSATWVALIVGATLMTRLAPRTIYLVFPSVYVLAGVAVAWSFDVARRILGSGWWRGRVAELVVGGATAWLLVPTLLLRLGFLWGDLRVSALWWPYQP